MADVKASADVEVKNAVRGFIIDNFLFGAVEDAPDDETSFLETGVIDSTGILELVTFVESTYAIEVADEDMVPENLDSLSNISAFVSRKRAVVAS